MKITFTIEDQPDGGMLLLMDPPASELLLLALGGGSTLAVACALTAYRHVLEAMVQATGAEHVHSGETPAKVH